MEITLNELIEFSTNKIKKEHNPHAKNDLTPIQYERYKYLRALKGISSELRAQQIIKQKQFNPRLIQYNSVLTLSNGYFIDVDIMVAGVTIDVKFGHQYDKLYNADKFAWFWWVNVEIPVEYVEITMSNGRAYELLSNDFPAVIDTEKWEYTDEGLLNSQKDIYNGQRFKHKGFRTIDDFWEIQFGIVE